MPTEKPLHPESSIFRSQSFRFDEVCTRLAPIKWDGSFDDTMTFLHTMEKVMAPVDKGFHSYFGKETVIELMPMHLQIAMSRYNLRRFPDAPIYVVDSQVKDALMNTDLTWIDAQSFAALPECISIVVSQPSSNLAIFHKDEFGGDSWLPVSDFIMWRVHDPDQRDRVAMSLARVDLSDPSIQVFAWLAVSRTEFVKGAISANWGCFAIGDNCKLDDLHKGLEDTLKRVAEVALSQEAPDPVPVAPNLAPDVQETIIKLQIENKGFLQDFQHADEQNASMQGCVTFIAKFVLLHSCDWFKERAIPMLPPGIKTFPRKAGQLWDQFGKRFKVTLPPSDMSHDDEDETDLHERKSPTRHWVRGFFRQQPYGPGRTLRRTKWISPFWRGTFLKQE